MGKTGIPCIIDNESQIQRWDDIKAKITTETAIDRHRASNDAYLIQETYRKIARSQSD